MNFGPVDAKEAEIFAFEELRADIQYEILKALKSKGLTQAALAVRMGCSPAWISQLLSDDANLTLESIAKIFLAMGLRFEARALPLDDHFENACGGDVAKGSVWHQEKNEVYHSSSHSDTSKLLMAIFRDTHKTRFSSEKSNDNGAENSGFWNTKEFA